MSTLRFSAVVVVPFGFVEAGDFAGSIVAGEVFVSSGSGDDDAREGARGLNDVYQIRL